MPSSAEHRDTVRRIHRVSVVAGAVVIVLALIATLTRPTPCGKLPSSYAPIVAFELARDARDLHAIFGGPGRCRTTMIAAMDTANTVDVVAFIPAYGLFLVAAFVGLGRRGRPGARAGVMLALIAVGADLVENLCLFGLTPTLDVTSASMKLLPWVTAVKWLALGGAGAAAAAALWPGEGRRHRITAALCALTPAVALAAMAWPHTFGPALGGGVAVSWIALLTDGVAQARARA